MIELIYEGKDINLEADVAVTGCVYTDCVHGAAKGRRFRGAAGRHTEREDVCLQTGCA